MTKIYKALFCLFYLLLLCSHVDAERIRVTIKVVDDEGNPVRGADARISFESRESSYKRDSKEGKTDKEGIFTYRSKAYNDVFLHVSKDGYYENHRRTYPFRMTDYGSAVLKNGKPIYEDQFVEMVLKKIRNPIPLYAQRNMDFHIPILDKELGFDLIKRDWVPPYGQGENADVLVNYHLEYNMENDYKMELIFRFPNPHEGLIEYDIIGQRFEGSDLKSDYLAPKEGYEQEKKWYYIAKKEKDESNKSDDKGYWICFRSEHDFKGNLISACYGKFYKTVSFSGGHNIEGVFRFGGGIYLNPTPNDRNLEWDMKNNLYKDISKYRSSSYPQLP